MGKITIIFNKIEIIEWYDGIVRAISETPSQIYLLVLVSWDIKQQVKLYALIELDEGTKNQIFKELNENRSKEENWEAFNSIFNNHIKNYNGGVHLILGEIEKNKLYELKIIATNHIRKLENYELEDTIDKNVIDYWNKLYM